MNDDLVLCVPRLVKPGLVDRLPVVKVLELDQNSFFVCFLAYDKPQWPPACSHLTYFDDLSYHGSCFGSWFMFVFGEWYPISPQNESAFSVLLFFFFNCSLSASHSRFEF